jgi:hypothetical protein
VAFSFVCPPWIIPGEDRMSRKRAWISILLTCVGLAAGLGLGLLYSWEIAPVEYTDTDISHLHPVYKDDFIVMVSKAYALDGDLDTARARMALLGLNDAPGAVADLAEQKIAQNAPPPQIRPLVQLASAMGASRASFELYLPQDSP